VKDPVTENRKRLVLRQFSIPYCIPMDFWKKCKCLI